MTKHPRYLPAIVFRLGLASFLLSCASVGYSQNGPENSVRIDVVGHDHVKVTFNSIEKGKGGNATWAGDNNAKIVIGAFPADSSWKEASITVTPSQSGTIELGLKGPYAPEDTGSSKLKPVFCDFDNVTATGVEVQNGSFESNSENGHIARWIPIKRPDSNPPTDSVPSARLERGKAQEGDYFIRVWHNSYYSQHLTVEKDVPVTIRFWFRLADKE